MVALGDFAKALNGVSESAIRKDPKILEGEGQIVLLRGGVAKTETSSYDIPIDSRGLYKIKGKEAIVKTVTQLAGDREIIYVDVGITCLKMIPYLKSKKIIVVTINTMVVPGILETEIDAIMTGGDALKPTASIVGSMTNNNLKNMSFNKAFIGVTGYDPQSGTSIPDSRETDKKRVAKEDSAQTHVPVDSLRSGKCIMCEVMELSERAIIIEKETPLLREYVNHILARDWEAERKTG